MTPRFVLLIVLFVTGSAYMLTNVFSPFTDPRELQSGCQLAAGVNPNVNSTANALAMSTPAYTACVKTYVSGWGYVWLPYLATAVLLVLALLLYVLLPRWKARTGKVVPLERADRDGTLRAALGGLAGRSGLRRSPGFVVNPGARGAGALVFGRLGRYTVRLDGPLLATFSRDRPAFEATMLHEFAHIRNKDVDITYLTVAIWRLFLLGALLPYVVRTVWLFAHGALWHVKPMYWSGDAPQWVRDLVLSAFIVALVYLVRADILRNREIYADIEAIRLGADRARWTDHVPATPRGRGRSRVVRVLRTAVRTHPDWTMRVATLADPAALFTVRARSMFLTGATAEVLGHFLAETPATGQYLERFALVNNVVDWLPALLVTGVAGLAVWRSVVHSVGNELPAPSGLRAGLWLGAGNLVGELLVNPATTNPLHVTFSEVLLLPLLLVAPTAVLWWTAGCAALWADLPHRRGRLAAAACTLAGTGLAFFRLYDWWQTIDAAYATGNPFGADFAYALYGDLTHTPTMDTIAALTVPVATLTGRWNLVLTAALWLVPLIGLTRRARPRPASSGHDGRLRAWGPLRTLSAGGVSGLIGGAAGAAGVLVITGRAHLWMQHGDQSPYQVTFIHSAWVLAILLAGTVAAAAAASAATHGNAAPAMAAAGSAMALGLAVFVVVIETNGCVGPLSIVPPRCTPGTGADWAILRLTLWDLLGPAGSVSLIAALLAAGFIKVWSPLDTVANPADEPEPPPARRTLRIVFTVPVCVLLAAMCALTYFGETSGSTRSDSTRHAIALAGNVGVAPQVRTQQVRAWLYFGGKKLIHQYDVGTLGITNAVHGGHVDPPAMRRACAALIQIAGRGQAYFPPPDAQKPAWSAFLAKTITGARKCVNGVDHADHKVLASGIDDIVVAQGTALQVITKFAKESA